MDKAFIKGTISDGLALLAASKQRRIRAETNPDIVDIYRREVESILLLKSRIDSENLSLFGESENGKTSPSKQASVRS